MTRYELEATAEDIGRAADLCGRQAVVTGATSGLGLETARALAIAGATVVIGVRDVSRGEELARAIPTRAGGSVRVLPLELQDLKSVAGFADQIGGPLDLLIANAGVSQTPETHLPNGLELRFAINHLSHFVLAQCLRKRMAMRGARIVVLSSTAHKGMRVRLDDLQWRKRSFSLAAYPESKTANIHFAQEATRRWGGDGIYANAVLPGSAITGLQRHHSTENMRQFGFVLPDGSPNPALRSIGRAAATTVWAATAPELEGRGGLVLEHCAEALPAADWRSWTGYDPSVIDAATAHALWEESTRLARQLLGSTAMAEWDATFGS